MSLECHWYYAKDYIPRRFGENRLVSSCSHQNDHTGSRQITKSLTSTVLSKFSQCVSPVFNHWLVYNAVQINVVCEWWLLAGSCDCARHCALFVVSCFLCGGCCTNLLLCDVSPAAPVSYTHLTLPTTTYV